MWREGCFVCLVHANLRAESLLTKKHIQWRASSTLPRTRARASRPRGTPGAARAAADARRTRVPAWLPREPPARPPRVAGAVSARPACTPRAPQAAQLSSHGQLGERRQAPERLLGGRAQRDGRRLPGTPRGGPRGGPRWRARPLFALSRAAPRGPADHRGGLPRRHPYVLDLPACLTPADPPTHQPSSPPSIRPLPTRSPPIWS